MSGPSCQTCGGCQVVRVPFGSAFAMSTIAAQKFMPSGRPVFGTICTGHLWWKRERRGIVAWEIPCPTCSTGENGVDSGLQPLEGEHAADRPQ